MQAVYVEARPEVCLGSVGYQRVVKISSYFLDEL